MVAGSELASEWPLPGDSRETVLHSSLAGNPLSTGWSSGYRFSQPHPATDHHLRCQLNREDAERWMSALTTSMGLVEHIVTWWALI